MHGYKKKKNKFYHWKYDRENTDNNRSKLKPLKARERAYDSGQDYFSKKYHISLHYINRYIERVFLKDPDKYSYKDKKRLARMLKHFLPVGKHLLSTNFKEFIGFTSIIRNGIAITVIKDKD